MTERAKLLSSLLLAIPPNFSDAEAFCRQSITPYELTQVALQYADHCFWEVRDTLGSYPLEIAPNLHSTYLLDVISLLLQFGLDPNAILDHDNIMHVMKHVDNELIGADTLALLLEHGGDPNLRIDDDSLFLDVDFDVFFGTLNQYNRSLLTSLVHCWMVTLGYGGKYLCDGVVTLMQEFETGKLFDLSRLKKHRKFFFGFSVEKSEIILHIYNKTTLCEVAAIRY